MRSSCWEQRRWTQTQETAGSKISGKRLDWNTKWTNEGMRRRWRAAEQHRWAEWGGGEDSERSWCGWGVEGEADSGRAQEHRKQIKRERWQRWLRFHAHKSLIFYFRSTSSFCVYTGLTCEVHKLSLHILSYKYQFVCGKRRPRGFCVCASFKHVAPAVAGRYRAFLTIKLRICDQFLKDLLTDQILCWTCILYIHMIHRR